MSIKTMLLKGESRTRSANRSSLHDLISSSSRSKIPTLVVLAGVLGMGLTSLPSANAQQWIMSSSTTSWSVHVEPSGTNPSPSSTIYFSGAAMPSGPSPYSNWTATLTAPPLFSSYNSTTSFTAGPGFGLTYNNLALSDDPYTLDLTSAAHSGYIYTATLFTAKYTKYQEVHPNAFTLLWAYQPPPPASTVDMGLADGTWTVGFRLHTTATLTSSQIIQTITATSADFSSGGGRWSFTFPNGNSNDPNQTVTPGNVTLSSDTQYDWCLVSGTTIDVNDSGVQAQFVSQHIQTLP